MTDRPARSHPDNHWPSPRIAALIPAFRPPEVLGDVIAELLSAGCRDIVLVDDGSGAGHAGLFSSLGGLPGVTLVTHPENLGKGAALRSGIRRLMSGAPGITGIVTLDADGQHRPADAARIAATLGQNPDSLVLGARAFDPQARVPFRSRVGNGLTRFLFRMIYGGGVEDTQTGLRGLPLAFLPAALSLPSNRYDYELDMLIEAVRQKRPIINVPIETVYIDGNRSSHFNPVLDSLRIYFSLLRFSASALTAVVLDFLVFYILLGVTANIALSLAGGRVLATTVNFAMNRKFVFRYRQGVAGALARYLALVVLLAVLSYVLILQMSTMLGISPLAAKLIAEGLLFVVSFLVQRHFVFAGGRAS